MLCMSVSLRLPFIRGKIAKISKLSRKFPQKLVFTEKFGVSTTSNHLLEPLISFSAHLFQFLHKNIVNMEGYSVVGNNVIFIMELGSVPLSDIIRAQAERKYFFFFLIFSSTFTCSIFPFIWHKNVLNSFLFRWKIPRILGHLEIEL